MLTCILIGVCMVGTTVGIHALGTTAWFRVLQRREAALQAPVATSTALSAVSSTAIVLMMLHVCEVVLWALTYLLLPDIGEIDTIEQAAYFSIVTFTTLGFGDITLSNHWRLLSGIEAMNGIMLFGWSTALLMALVNRLWFPHHE